MATSRVMRQLLAIVEAYYDEPEASGSDDATERDLEYFDRIIALLARQRRHRARRPSPVGMDEYRVRWEIDLSARCALEAACKARAVQVQLDSLATVFEVLRRKGRTDKLDWSRAETIDLTAVLRHGRTADSRR